MARMAWLCAAWKLLRGMSCLFLMLRMVSGCAALERVCAARRISISRGREAERRNRRAICTKFEHFSVSEGWLVECSWKGFGGSAPLVATRFAMEMALRMHQVACMVMCKKCDRVCVSVCACMCVCAPLGTKFLRFSYFGLVFSAHLVPSTPRYFLGHCTLYHVQG